MQYASEDKLYSFDRVFSPHVTQTEVYEAVKSHVQAAVRGYNATIFAYGSTGSGKTYTLTGGESSAEQGIISRTVSDIFKLIDSYTTEDNNLKFSVRLSYVELYNNNFRSLLDLADYEDLLSTEDSSFTPTGYDTNDGGVFSDPEWSPVPQQSGVSPLYLSDTTLPSPFPPRSVSRSQLKPPIIHSGHSGGSTYPYRPPTAEGHEKIEIRECSTAGMFLTGPNLRIPVRQAADALLLIRRGNKNRAVTATNCNQESSR